MIIMANARAHHRRIRNIEIKDINLGLKTEYNLESFIICKLFIGRSHSFKDYHIFNL